MVVALSTASKEIHPMRFSIRDLFLVTMIVALAVGWCLDRSRLANEVNRLRPAEFQLSPNGTFKPPSGFRAIGVKGKTITPN